MLRGERSRGEPPDPRDARKSSFANRKSLCRGRRGGAQTWINLRRRRLDDFPQRSGRLCAGGGTKVLVLRCRVSKPAGSDNLFDLCAFERFVLQKAIGNQLELVPMGVNDLFGSPESVINDAFD